MAEILLNFSKLRIRMETRTGIASRPDMSHVALGVIGGLLVVYGMCAPLEVREGSDSNELTTNSHATSPFQEWHRVPSHCHRAAVWCRARGGAADQHEKRKTGAVHILGNLWTWIPVSQ